MYNSAADGFDIVGNCSTRTLENICILIIGYILLHCVNNVSIPSIVFDENDVKRAT